MFTWYINEPVSNFAPQQLTYTVKPIKPKDGGWNIWKITCDRDGSQHYEGLYTNQEAVLYPVDSRGNEYRPEEFPKPTVSYVVEHGSQEPGPDPNPTPNPGNNGGGSHGGHGGGSSSAVKSLRPQPRRDRQHSRRNRLRRLYQNLSRLYRQKDFRRPGIRIGWMCRWLCWQLE